MFPKWTIWLFSAIGVLGLPVAIILPQYVKRVVTTEVAGKTLKVVEPGTPTGDMVMDVPTVKVTIPNLLGRPLFCGGDVQVTKGAIFVFGGVFGANRYDCVIFRERDNGELSSVMTDAEGNIFFVTEEGLALLESSDLEDPIEEEVYWPQWLFPHEATLRLGSSEVGVGGQPQFAEASRASGGGTRACLHDAHPTAVFFYIKLTRISLSTENSRS